MTGRFMGDEKKGLTGRKGIAPTAQVGGAGEGLGGENYGAGLAPPRCFLPGSPSVPITLATKVASSR